MSKAINIHLDLKKMRLIIFTFSLIGQICILQQAFPQVETQTDTTNQLPDSNFQYINSMEYAFMMHEETSWMLKGSLILMEEYTNQMPDKVAFEKRIANTFTINLALDHIYPEIPGDNLNHYSLHGSIETRWYYRLNKRIKQNMIARNMSDNYFALGLGYFQLFDLGLYPEKLDNNYLSLYAKWGLQRRFLKHGHADIGINVGIIDKLDKGFKPSLVFNTYVELGLCFTKDRFKLDHDKLCPYIKCYASDKFIIKSNLSDLLNVGFFKYNRWIDLSPHIALERKIGSSAFSINTEINTTVGYSEVIPDDKNYNTYFIAALHLESRYYYNLNKRIIMGNSGNGLSADYITFGGSYYYIKDSRDEILSNEGPQLHVATGWQRLFSNHMYYDIQVGIEYYFEPNRFRNLFGPRNRLALGYRF